MVLNLEFLCWKSMLYNIKVIPLHRFFMVLVFKVMKYLAS